VYPEIFFCQRRAQASEDLANFGRGTSRNLLLHSAKDSRLGHPFFSSTRFGFPPDSQTGLCSDGDSSGVGVGDAFLRFDLLFGVGDGVGEAFFRFAKQWRWVVSLSSSKFRCLRIGVGVGLARELFDLCLTIFGSRRSINTPNKITRIRSHFIIDA
jgi:hypothetical protein